VNLAARLEPLCKQYGVQVLVSQAVVDAAADELVFRHVDRVVVRGKTEAVDVFELVAEGT
jgi:adenylate cyclase